MKNSNPPLWIIQIFRNIWTPWISYFRNIWIPSEIVQPPSYRGIGEECTIRTERMCLCVLSSIYSTFVLLLPAKHSTLCAVFLDSTITVQWAMSKMGTVLEWGQV